MTTPNINDALLKTKQHLLVAWREARHLDMNSELTRMLASQLNELNKAIQLLCETDAKAQTAEGDWNAQLDTMINQDQAPNYIRAVKFYRSKHGCSLTEALFAVQRRATELNK